MPADPSPSTCPSCAGLLNEAPLDRCTEALRHNRPLSKPGKGFNPPYMRPLAEAVTDLEPEEGKPPWTS